jgi:hypothetical protein
MYVDCVSTVFIVGSEISGNDTLHVACFHELQQFKANILLVIWLYLYVQEKD